MKKKALVSSIATIVLCACLIAGSTFALFTGEATTSIAVTSGKVELEASVIGSGDSAPVLYSISPVSKANAFDAEGNLVDGVYAEYDENLEETFYYTHTGALTGNTFPNGGTASVEDGVVTFTNITPGDKMEINIAGISTSNVKTKVRYIVKPDFAAEDAGLIYGFTVSYGDTEFVMDADGVCVSEWFSVDADATGNGVEFETSEPIAIGLKVSAGNEYQDKSFSFTILVEAVQDNAVAN